LADSIKTNARSAQTREALLNAALEVFGRDGFHAASTRAIAEAAGVNQALIAYHFGGKEGLYLAVFENINESFEQHVSPVLDTMQAEIEALEGGTPAGRRTCLEYLDRLLGSSLGMFTQPRGPGWAKLVMREQQDPGDAFDIIYRGVYGEMLDTLTRLVGKLTNRLPDDPRTRILTITLMGQIIIVMIGRATTMRHMGWDDIGEPELLLAYQQVREGLYARFGGEVAE
jgi:AcrR family transcriptional regulator